MRIYVAGHQGLVGSAIARAIEKDGQQSWIGKTHAELDLLDRQSVFDYLASERPDAVVIAAAKVGGIQANNTFPVQFLSENLQIETNLLDASHAARIPRLLFLGSSCVYPKLSPQPIKEEYLLTGELEKTNEAYALAKIAGLRLVQAYRKQYGHSWISAMPTNIYGPGDNFNPESSHVLPALMRKFHDARQSRAISVTLWGSGSPLREFLHADDLASAVLFLLKRYDHEVPINVGAGKEISILVLAELIREIINYDGEIYWDNSRPDGTSRKLLDISKITDLGWKAKIPLRTGIQKTYFSFLENQGRTRL